MTLNYLLGDKVKTCNVIYAVLGNYAVNLVLPRVGEVWRCGMITKYDKIPDNIGSQAKQKGKKNNSPACIRLFTPLVSIQ